MAFSEAQPFLLRVSESRCCAVPPPPFIYKPPGVSGIWFVWSAEWVGSIGQVICWSKPVHLNYSKPPTPKHNLRKTRQFFIRVIIVRFLPPNLPGRTHLFLGGDRMGHIVVGQPGGWVCIGGVCGKRDLVCPWLASELALLAHRPCGGRRRSACQR